MSARDGAVRRRATPVAVGVVLLSGAGPAVAGADRTSMAATHGVARVMTAPASAAGAAALPVRLPAVVGPGTSRGPSAWRPVGPAPGVGDVLNAGRRFTNGDSSGLGSRGDVLVALSTTPRRAEGSSGAQAPLVTPGVLLVTSTGITTGRLPASRRFGTPAVVDARTVVVPVESDDQRVAAMRTADGGRTWSPVTPPRCGTGAPAWSAVAFDGAGRGVALGTFDAVGCVWTSSDAGRTWRLRTDDVPLAAPAVAADGRLLAIGTPASASGRAISFGDGALAQSTDDGATWTAVPLPPVPPAEQPPVRRDPATGTTTPVPATPPEATTAAGPVLVGDGGRVVLGSSTGALLMATDGGHVFTRVEVGARRGEETQPRRGIVVPLALPADGSALVSALPPGGSEEQLLRLRDGSFSGASPLRVTDPVVGVGPLFRATTVDGRRSLQRVGDDGSTVTELAGGRTAPRDVGTAGVAAVVRDGVLWSSRDGGASWRTASLPAGTVSRVRAVVPVGRDLLVLDVRGRLQAVSPAGAWRRVALPSGLGARALGRAGADVVAVGAGGIARSADGGSFRRVGGVATRRGWTRIAGGRRLLVVQDAHGRMSRSVDGGRRWSRAGRASRSAGRALGVGGTRTVMVIAERRLWTSRDGGRTFRPGPLLRRPNEGWSGRPGSIVVRDDRRALVAVYGRLLRTDDAGRTVRDVPLPGGAGPETVSDAGGGRLLVQDDLSGDLLRSTPLR